MAFNGELFQIFSWLPAKAIYKFASISKSCKQLAREDFFMKKQSKNMQSKDELGFFIQPNSSQSYMDLLELHALPGEGSTFGVPQTSLMFLSTTARVLASSNGLLCCRNLNSKQPGLFICNPATGTWLSIPNPDGPKYAADKDINVAFDCSKDECAIMAIVDTSKEWSSNAEWKCKMYSLRERRWREGGTIMSGCRNIHFDMPVWSNRHVYFLSDWSPYFTKKNPYYWPYIVAYDFENGTSIFLRLPKDARKGGFDDNCEMSIVKWRNQTFDSICLIKLRKLVVSAWALMDHNSSSWSRIIKIRVRAKLGFTEPEPSVAGITVMNGNSLLIATQEKIYRYKLPGSKHEKAEEICRHEWRRNVRFHSYSNTLRSCGDGATQLPI